MGMENATILVVEDERIVAKDLARRLQKLGCRVPAVVGSGTEAIQKAAEIQPDLILMDIHL
jgi:CheY-like chemotaxis protein